MNSGHSAPTHLDQIEDALEERQTPDRRQQPSCLQNPVTEERRKGDRRKEASKP